MNAIRKSVSFPTQQNIKAIHLKEIYRKALGSDGISRAQLKRELHLSFPSVSALVEELLAHGVLTEAETLANQDRGRPRRMLRVNPQALTIPAAVMTREGYRYTLFDCCACRIDQGFLPFERKQEREERDGRWHPKAETLWSPLRDWIAGLRAEHRMSELLLCVPGNFNEEGVLSSSALKLVSPKDFLGQLREAVGLEVAVTNNADCCAYAERLCQDLPEDFIFIQVAKGVGAGIIREGRIFGEGVMRAGEIGHVSIDYNGRPCLCGSRGCLERYLSLTEITGEVRELLGPSIGDFDAVCREYRRGDPQVAALLREKAALLAMGISNMLTMQPVTYVVLGGGIEKLGESFLESVRNSVKTRGFRKFMDRVTVTYTENADGEESLGALWNYLDNRMEMDSMLRR